MAITWTTASGTLTTVQSGSAVSKALEAYQADSGITYSIVAGALPSGLALNSATGEITGSTSATVGVYSFTVRATKGASTVDRVFTINVTT
jgi:hypothetical protein